MKRNKLSPPPEKLKCSVWKRCGRDSFRPLARLKRNWTPVLSGLSLDSKQASATEPHHFKRPRLYDREMGGGSLLDLGVYLVSLGQYLFGTPHCQSASLAAYNEDTDLDTEAFITCAYPEISSVPIRAVFAMPFHAAQSFEVSLETSRYHHPFTVRKGSSL